MCLTQQSKEFLQNLEAQRTPPVESLPPAQGRRLFAALNRWHGERIEIEKVEDFLFPGNVKARLYRSTDSSGSGQEKMQPAVVYFHGGGWVLGNLDTHDVLCRHLAQKSQCTVIAIDYHLSPEAKYPLAFDQCYSAVTHTIDHASSLKINPDRVAVAGDSAGGNLAAAVALRARDSSGPDIDLQILIYPVLNPDFQQESYVKYSEGFGLTRGRMQWFWSQYLGSTMPDCYAAPGLSGNLKGLPTTHLITAEYDVLRSEGELYAKRLIDAGVPTTLKRYHGNLHGFVHFAGIFDDGHTAMTEIARYCGTHLHR